MKQLTFYLNHPHEDVAGFTINPTPKGSLHTGRAYKHPNRLKLSSMNEGSGAFRIHICGSGNQLFMCTPASFPGLRI